MKHSIIKYLSAYVCLIVIIALLMMGTIVKYYIDAMNKSAYDNIEDIITQTDRQISDNIIFMDKFNFEISNDFNVKDYLAASAKGDNEVNIQDSYDKYSVALRLTDREACVLLFDANGKPYDLLRDIEENEKEVMTDYCNKYIGTEDSQTFVFTDEDSIYNTVYLGIYRPVTRLKTDVVETENLGAVLTFLKMNVRSFYSTNAFEGYLKVEITDIVTGETTCLYDNSEEYDSYDFITQTDDVSDVLWKIKVEMSKNVFHFDKKFPIVMMTSLIILLLIAVLAFRFVIYLLIDKNISYVKMYLKDFVLGKKRKKKKKLKISEFNEILDSVDSMMDNIENDGRKIVRIQQNLYEKEIEQSNTLMYMYALQINPHFIYNTLGYISSCAAEKGVDEISEISDDIATILRYGMRQPFEAELESEVYVAVKYMEIFKKRYPDILEYQVNVNGTEDAVVLKMILQPVIENACKHGIQPKHNKGIIKISAERNGDYLILSVYDNGMGIPPEKYREIMSSFRLNTRNRIDNPMSRIGLWNVHTRLMNYYGKDSGVEIETEYGKYTKVNLKIYLPEITS